MAYRTSGNPSYLSRNGCIDPTLGWSWTGWFRCPSFPSSFYDIWIFGDTINFNDSTIYTYFQASGVFTLEVADGPDDAGDIDSSVLNANQWYFLSVVYDATLHTISTYLGSGSTATSLIGSF